MSKRSSNENKIKILVEVNAQTDLEAFKFTKGLLKLSDSEVELFLSVFLVQAIRSVDLIYNSNKDDYLDIRLKLVKLRIDTPSNSHQNEKFNGTQAECSLFLSHAAAHFRNTFKNDDIETFDHGILFTKTNQFGTTLGCAYIAAVCDRNSKYSTVNLHYFSIFDIGTVAHEIGHNLGLTHTEISNKN
jgi:predicted Zn-dependent protease